MTWTKRVCDVWCVCVCRGQPQQQQKWEKKSDHKIEPRRRVDGLLRDYFFFFFVNCKCGGGPGGALLLVSFVARKMYESEIRWRWTVRWATEDFLYVTKNTHQIRSFSPLAAANLQIMWMTGDEAMVRGEKGCEHCSSITRPLHAKLPESIKDSILCKTADVRFDKVRYQSGRLCDLLWHSRHEITLTHTVTHVSAGRVIVIACIGRLLGVVAVKWFELNFVRRKQEGTLPFRCCSAQSNVKMPRFCFGLFTQKLIPFEMSLWLPWRRCV